MNILEVNNLSKYYRTSKAIVKAVNHISFNIPKGQTLALVGESGSGKTTTAHCILGLTKITAGDIWLKKSDKESINIAKLPKDKYGLFRKSIQIIFQEPGSSLNPRKKIRYLVTRPLQIWGELTSTEIDGRLSELMNFVNLPLSLLDYYPKDLTPGQQQKISIIRSIINNPDLLVLDEPTSSLDCVSKIEVLNLLINLQKKYNLSYLYISHDLATVKYISNKIAVMYLGQIVEIAPTDKIIKNHLHPYTKALWHSSLDLEDDRRVTKNREKLLKGEIPSPINLPKGCYLYSRCPYAIEDCNKNPQKLIEVEKEHSVACYRIDIVKNK
jgi:oligopeptide/dipeptide ABC transporter ATP-binding protein